MKRVSPLLYIFLLAVTLGCSKNSPEIKEEIATKFPVPNWKTDDTGKYPATMTAVFTLPATLAGNLMENDKLAAFVNDECRGVGVIVENNSLKLFFVLIQGLPEETNKIIIRYYSNKTSYLYESQPALTFLADGIHGTAENPKILELTQLK
jgi:hypothetical protein